MIDEEKFLKRREKIKELEHDVVEAIAMFRNIKIMGNNFDVDIAVNALLFQNIFKEIRDIRRESDFPEMIQEEEFDKILDENKKIIEDSRWKSVKNETGDIK